MSTRSGTILVYAIYSSQDHPQDLHLQLLQTYEGFNVTKPGTSGSTSLWKKLAMSCKSSSSSGKKKRNSAQEQTSAGTTSSSAIMEQQQSKKTGLFPTDFALVENCSAANVDDLVIACGARTTPSDTNAQQRPQFLPNSGCLCVWSTLTSKRLIMCETWELNSIHAVPGNFGSSSRSSAPTTATSHLLFVGGRGGVLCWEVVASPTAASATATAASNMGSNSAPLPSASAVLLAKLDTAFAVTSITSTRVSGTKATSASTTSNDHRINDEDALFLILNGNIWVDFRLWLASRLQLSAHFARPRDFCLGSFSSSQHSVLLPDTSFYLVSRSSGLHTAQLLRYRTQTNAAAVGSSGMLTAATTAAGSSSLHFDVIDVTPPAPSSKTGGEAAAAQQVTTGIDILDAISLDIADSLGKYAYNPARRRTTTEHVAQIGERSSKKVTLLLLRLRTAGDTSQKSSMVLVVLDDSGATSSFPTSANEDHDFGSGPTAALSDTNLVLRLHDIEPPDTSSSHAASPTSAIFLLPTGILSLRERDAEITFRPIAFKDLLPILLKNHDRQLRKKELSARSKAGALSSGKNVKMAQPPGPFSQHQRRNNEGAPGDLHPATAVQKNLAHGELEQSEDRIRKPAKRTTRGPSGVAHHASRRPNNERADQREGFRESPLVFDHQQHQEFHDDDDEAPPGADKEDNFRSDMNNPYAKMQSKTNTYEDLPTPSKQKRRAPKNLQIETGSPSLEPAGSSFVLEEQLQGGRTNGRAGIRRPDLLQENSSGTVSSPTYQSAQQLETVTPAAWLGSTVSSVDDVPPRLRRASSARSRAGRVENFVGSDNYLFYPEQQEDHFEVGGADFFPPINREPDEMHNINPNYGSWGRDREQGAESAPPGSAGTQTLITRAVPAFTGTVARTTNTNVVPAAGQQNAATNTSSKVKFQGEFEFPIEAVPTPFLDHSAVFYWIPTRGMLVGSANLLATTPFLGSAQIVPGGAGATTAESTKVMRTNPLPALKDPQAIEQIRPSRFSPNDFNPYGLRLWQMSPAAQNRRSAASDSLSKPSENSTPTDLVARPVWSKLRVSATRPRKMSRQDKDNPGLPQREAWLVALPMLQCVALLRVSFQETLFVERERASSQFQHNNQPAAMYTKPRVSVECVHMISTLRTVSAMLLTQPQVNYGENMVLMRDTREQRRVDFFSTTKNLSTNPSRQKKLLLISTVSDIHSTTVVVDDETRTTVDEGTSATTSTNAGLVTTVDTEKIDKISLDVDTERFLHLVAVTPEFGQAVGILNSRGGCTDSFMLGGTTTQQMIITKQLSPLCAQFLSPLAPAAGPAALTTSAAAATSSLRYQRGGVDINKTPTSAKLAGRQVERHSEIFKLEHLVDENEEKLDQHFTILYEVFHFVCVRLVLGSSQEHDLLASSEQLLDKITPRSPSPTPRAVEQMNSSRQQLPPFTPRSVSPSTPKFTTPRAKTLSARDSEKQRAVALRRGFEQNCARVLAYDGGLLFYERLAAVVEVLLLKLRFVVTVGVEFCDLAKAEIREREVRLKKERNANAKRAGGSMSNNPVAGTSSSTSSSSSSSGAKASKESSSSGNSNSSSSSSSRSSSSAAANGKNKDSHEPNSSNSSSSSSPAFPNSTSKTTFQAFSPTLSSAGAQQQHQTSGGVKKPIPISMNLANKGAFGVGTSSHVAPQQKTPQRTVLTHPLAEALSQINQEQYATLSKQREKFQRFLDLHRSSSAPAPSTSDVDQGILLLGDSHKDSSLHPSLAKAIARLLLLSFDDEEKKAFVRNIELRASRYAVVVGLDHFLRKTNQLERFFPGRASQARAAGDRSIRSSAIEQIQKVVSSQIEKKEQKVEKKPGSSSRKSKSQHASSGNSEDDDDDIVPRTKSNDSTEQLNRQQNVLGQTQQQDVAPLLLGLLLGGHRSSNLKIGKSLKKRTASRGRRSNASVLKSILGSSFSRSRESVACLQYYLSMSVVDGVGGKQENEYGHQQRRPKPGVSAMESPRSGDVQRSLSMLPMMQKNERETHGHSAVSTAEQVVNAVRSANDFDVGELLTKSGLVATEMEVLQHKEAGHQTEFSQDGSSTLLAYFRCAELFPRESKTAESRQGLELPYNYTCTQKLQNSYKPDGGESSVGMDLQFGSFGERRGGEPGTPGSRQMIDAAYLVTMRLTTDHMTTYSPNIKSRTPPRTMPQWELGDIDFSVFPVEQEDQWGTALQPNRALRFRLAARSNNSVLSISATGQPRAEANYDAQGRAAGFLNNESAFSSPGRASSKKLSPVSEERLGGSSGGVVSLTSKDNMQMTENPIKRKKRKSSRGLHDREGQHWMPSPDQSEFGFDFSDIPEDLLVEHMGINTDATDGRQERADGETDPPPAQPTGPPFLFYRHASEIGKRVYLTTRMAEVARLHQSHQETRSQNASPRPGQQGLTPRDPDSLATPRGGPAVHSFGAATSSSANARTADEIFTPRGGRNLDPRLKSPRSGAIAAAMQKSGGLRKNLLFPPGSTPGRGSSASPLQTPRRGGASDAGEQHWSPPYLNRSTSISGSKTLPRRTDSENTIAVLDLQRNLSSPKAANRAARGEGSGRERGSSGMGGGLGLFDES
ncbi:unnamed protein product, partial [Amoebophrya sp. A120]|eukprot:GSA120T00010463001.1